MTRFHILTLVWTAKRQVLAVVAGEVGGVVIVWDHVCGGSQPLCALNEASSCEPGHRLSGSGWWPVNTHPGPCSNTVLERTLLITTCDVGTQFTCIIDNWTVLKMCDTYNSEHFKCSSSISRCTSLVHHKRTHKLVHEKLTKLIDKQCNNLYVHARHEIKFYIRRNEKEKSVYK